MWYYTLCLGVRADTVGQEAGEKLLTELRHGGCIDNWSQDQVQLLPVLVIVP